MQEEEYGEEVDQKALDKADEIKLINSIELFRIKALKTALTNRTRYSYKAQKVLKQPVQKEELTEEELIEFERATGPINRILCQTPHHQIIQFFWYFGTVD